MLSRRLRRFPFRSRSLKSSSSTLQRRYLGWRLYRAYISPSRIAEHPEQPSVRDRRGHSTCAQGRFRIPSHRHWQTNAAPERSACTESLPNRHLGNGRPPTSLTYSPPEPNNCHGGTVFLALSSGLDDGNFCLLGTDMSARSRTSRKHMACIVRVIWILNRG